MKKLDAENVKKFLTALEDFQSAVVTAGSDDLEMKKVKAGLALEHITGMLNPDDNVELLGPPCRPPGCSEAPSTA